VPGAITAGVVIGLGPASAEAGPSEREFVLVSLHLRPGHSGGSLVDTAGRLVGINMMINGPDIGVAVPVNEVKLFLREALRA
jgi:S1-C subfamily serine protease